MTMIMFAGALCDDVGCVEDPPLDGIGDEPPPPHAVTTIESAATVSNAKTDR
jgi:hypothetical protein